VGYTAVLRLHHRLAVCEGACGDLRLGRGAGRGPFGEDPHVAGRRAIQRRCALAASFPVAEQHLVARLTHREGQHSSTLFDGHGCRDRIPGEHADAIGRSRGGVTVHRSVGQRDPRTHNCHQRTEHTECQANASHRELGVRLLDTLLERRARHRRLGRRLLDRQWFDERSRGRRFARVHNTRAQDMGRDAVAAPHHELRLDDVAEAHGVARHERVELALCLLLVTDACDHDRREPRLLRWAHRLGTAGRDDYRVGALGDDRIDDPTWDKVRVHGRAHTA
jgi:hypothetical protein